MRHANLLTRTQLRNILNGAVNDNDPALATVETTANRYWRYSHNLVVAHTLVLTMMTGGTIYAVTQRPSLFMLGTCIAAAKFASMALCEMNDNCQEQSIKLGQHAQKLTDNVQPG